MHGDLALTSWRSLNYQKACPDGCSYAPGFLRDAWETEGQGDWCGGRGSIRSAPLSSIQAHQLCMESLKNIHILVIMYKLEKRVSL